MRSVLVALALLASAHQAMAHDWYPANCCSGTDCHPVPCEAINEKANGAMSWNGWQYDKNQIKVSQDAQCHACHWGPHDAPGKAPSDHGYCLFILPTA